MKEKIIVGIILILLSMVLSYFIASTSPDDRSYLVPLLDNDAEVGKVELNKIINRYE